jgi:hypothetical protein
LICQTQHFLEEYMKHNEIGVLKIVKV